MKMGIVQMKIIHYTVLDKLNGRHVTRHVGGPMNILRVPTNCLFNDVSMCILYTVLIWYMYLLQDYGAIGQNVQMLHI